MVTIVKNVLPLDLVEALWSYPQHQPLHRTNLSGWPSNVVGSSGAILLYELEGSLSSSVKRHLLPVVGLEYENYDWYMIYTLGSYLSFIPWHLDEKHVRSMTIYLNKEWDRDWGGYFMYELENEIRAVKPTFNTGVLFTPPLPHTTTMPTINAPLRLSLQVFVNGKI